MNNNGSYLNGGDHLKDLEARVQKLEQSNEKGNDTVTDVIAAMHAKIKDEFKEAEREMAHKFGLQVAENRRLQSHVTGLKNEMHPLNSRMCSLEERTKIMEEDIGIEEA